MTKRWILILYPRWLLYITFLAVIIAVSVFHHIFDPPISHLDWTSDSQLLPNTRIQTSQLRVPSFPTPADELRGTSESDLNNKYIITEVPPTGPVQIANLSPVPSLKTSTDSALLFFSKKDVGSLIDHLNTNAKVYVCEENTPCDYEWFRVEAVLGKEESQVLVIRVPLYRAEAVRKLRKPIFYIASLR